MPTHSTTPRLRPLPCSIRPRTRRPRRPHTTTRRKCATAAPEGRTSTSTPRATPRLPRTSTGGTCHPQPTTPLPLKTCTRVRPPPPPLPPPATPPPPPRRPPPWARPPPPAPRPRRGLLAPGAGGRELLLRGRTPGGRDLHSSSPRHRLRWTATPRRPSSSTRPRPLGPRPPPPPLPPRPPPPSTTEATARAPAPVATRTLRLSRPPEASSSMRRIRAVLAQCSRVQKTCILGPLLVTVRGLYPRLLPRLPAPPWRWRPGPRPLPEAQRAPRRPRPLQGPCCPRRRPQAPNQHLNWAKRSKRRQQQQ